MKPVAPPFIIMKKLMVFKLAVVFLFAGCEKGIDVSDEQIQLAVQTGTSVTFQYGLQNSPERAMIANYVSAIAGIARSATGKQTPEELGKALNDAVPENIRTQIPQITSIVVPLVVSSYQAARDKYAGDYKKLYSRMNAVATGLENAVAQYTGKK
jgi:hypothetical protein